MSRISEFQTLKARTLALEKRLALLQGRLKKVQAKPGRSRFRAVIDPGRCIHCGRCEAVCPQGAVSVDADVRVDPTRCVGCGKCAAECPEGAISLIPTELTPARGVPFSKSEPTPSPSKSPGEFPLYDNHLLELIENRILNKPKKHGLSEFQPRKCVRPMNRIGG